MTDTTEGYAMVESGNEERGIVEFLTARLDEAEARARAATPGPWSTPGPDSLAPWTIYDDQWAIAHAVAYDHDNPLSNKPGARGPGYIDPDANAAHIAAHDPARTLADIAAKRRIVARHANCDDTSYGQPCDDLRDLASIDADHSDYQQEWAVSPR